MASALDGGPVAANVAQRRRRSRGRHARGLRRLALGFTRLAAATADPAWIERAEQLLAVVEAEFTDGAGGFYDTAADAEALYTRPKDPTDNATPSGLSTAVQAFALLAELTGRSDFADRAEAAERSAGALVRSGPPLRRLAAGQRGDPASPAAGPGRHRRPPVDPTTSRARALPADGRPAGSVIVAGSRTSREWPCWPDRPQLAGRPTAYVCRGFVCRLPVTDVDALLAQLP